MKYFLGWIFLVFSIQSYALTLPNLKEDTVLSGLYSGIFDPHINSNQIPDIENKKKIGTVVNGNKFLTIYDEMKEYTNAQGEQRFLVHVERRTIAHVNDDKYELKQMCYECSAHDDLFIFKQEPTGKYTLVSRTGESFPSFGEFGVSLLILPKSIYSIKPNAVGFFSEITLHKTNTIEDKNKMYGQRYERDYINFLYVILLNEDSEISANYVTKTPFDFIKWKVLTQEEPIYGYYPIEVKIYGAQKENNKISKYIMDRNLKEYKEISSVNYTYDSVNGDFIKLFIE